MNAVIDVVVPVFGLGLIGYIAARLGFFSENMAQGLARFVFDYAVPLLLIRMFSAASLPSSTSHHTQRDAARLARWRSASVISVSPPKCCTSAT